ncbi:hypothetical protein REG_1967 [Candidatus Regiella insecticola LSR1]|uniref:Uncharacterized protein n=1 Tax=Candidatus Regiella insecticola LSR1 TaxID=663321 RepID=E0WV52_9ENTR|nr:hypothetical protein REG_1967 [Candidatus Regiella insecticola LSR1]
MVEQMELIKAQAEDTCKSNPDPSIKRQCDGIITLAGKASEAAKGETKITVVRNYARSAERRLDAFVKQQSAVKAERALVKEMEDHIEKMKNFRLENEKINPSIKSYISEVILAAQSALRGARTRTATKFYQQAKSLIYIMENVKGEEKSIDDTQKAIVAEVRDYRTKFITVLSPLAKEEVESNIGKIKIFLNKGSKEKKAIVEALLSKDIAGAKKHLETLKEYRSNFFKVWKK